MIFDLPKALKTLKAQAGLTNEDIAKVTSKSNVSVSNWCTGKQEPSVSTLAELCESKGVVFSKFISWGE